MATLSLKISVVGQNVVKTMQFEPNMQVFDACRIIRDKLIETTTEKINRKYFVILRSPLSDHPCFFWWSEFRFLYAKSRKTACPQMGFLQHSENIQHPEVGFSWPLIWIDLNISKINNRIRCSVWKNKLELLHMGCILWIHLFFGQTILWREGNCIFKETWFFVKDKFYMQSYGEVVF